MPDNLPLSVIKRCSHMLIGASIGDILGSGVGAVMGRKDIKDIAKDYSNISNEIHKKNREVTSQILNYDCSIDDKINHLERLRLHRDKAYNTNSCISLDRSVDVINRNSKISQPVGKTIGVLVGAKTGKSFKAKANDFIKKEKQYLSKLKIKLL